MNQTDPASQQDPKKRPYRVEQPDGFSAALQGIPWEEDKDLGGVALVGKCPACTHDDGINVFLPYNLPEWDKTAQHSAQFVECQCAEPHDGRPATVPGGCGCWGMVTPKLA